MEKKKKKKKTGYLRVRSVVAATRHRVASQANPQLGECEVVLVRAALARTTRVAKQPLRVTHQQQYNQGAPGNVRETTVTKDGLASGARARPGDAEAKQ